MTHTMFFLPPSGLPPPSLLGGPIGFQLGEAGVILVLALVGVAVACALFVGLVARSASTRRPAVRPCVTARSFEPATRRTAGGLHHGHLRHEVAP